MFLKKSRRYFIIVLPERKGYSFDLREIHTYLFIPKTFPDPLDQAVHISGIIF